LIVPLGIATSKYKGNIMSWIEVAVLVILVLLACLLVVGIVVSIEPVVGTVVNKIYVAEHEDSDTTYIRVGDIDIPIVNYYMVPDKWYLTIQTKSGRHHDIEVNQDRYNKTKVGDLYGYEQNE
jgi:hypothetical protein